MRVHIVTYICLDGGTRFVLITFLKIIFKIKLYHIFFAFFNIHDVHMLLLYLAII